MAIIKIPTVVQNDDEDIEKADQYINTDYIACFNKCPKDEIEESKGLAKTQITLVSGEVAVFVYATITPEELIEIIRNEDK